jgi:hypothetical protein
MSTTQFALQALEGGDWVDKEKLAHLVMNTVKPERAMRIVDAKRIDEARYSLAERVYRCRKRCAKNRIVWLRYDGFIEQTHIDGKPHLRITEKGIECLNKYKKSK